MILSGKRVVLRPASAQDVPRLTAILREPKVAHRWGTYDEARVAAEFVRDDKVFVVEVHGEVIGSIQYSEENNRCTGMRGSTSSSRSRIIVGASARTPSGRWLGTCSMSVAIIA